MRRQVRGLEIPWDVKPIAGGRLLITERDSADLLLRRGRRHPTGSRFPSGKVWVSGETGLMSLEIDPDFATQRPLLHLLRLAASGGGGHDVRVNAWRLNAAGTRARPGRERWSSRLPDHAADGTAAAGC